MAKATIFYEIIYTLFYSQKEPCCCGIICDSTVYFTEDMFFLKQRIHRYGLYVLSVHRTSICDGPDPPI